MSALPTFNYYQELNVERTASLEQITSAYRRLAIVRHPDRNHGNEEQATVAFQRLQQAYEVLSDPSKRDRYDNPRPNAPSPFSNSSGQWTYDDDDDDEFDFDESFFGPRFGFPFGGGFSFFGGGGWRGPSFEEWEREMDRRQRRAAEREAAYQELLQNIYKRRQEALWKAQEERCKREEQERVRREAKLAAKLAEKEAAIAEKHHRREEELRTQEQRWRDAGAITKDERLLTCLHSEFCSKIEQQRKFKCSACSVKRGMVAFECPHCSVYLCQLCVTNFSTRRQKLAKKEKSTTSGPSEESFTHTEDVKAAKPPEPAEPPGPAEPQAIFAEQNFTQEKANKKMKNKSDRKKKSTANTPHSSTGESPSSDLPNRSPRLRAEADEDAKTNATPDSGTNIETCNVFLVSEMDDSELQASGEPEHINEKDVRAVKKPNTKPAQPKQKERKNGKDSTQGLVEENIEPKPRSSATSAATVINEPGGKKGTVNPGMGKGQGTTITGTCKRGKANATKSGKNLYPNANFGNQSKQTAAKLDNSSQQPETKNTFQATGHATSATQSIRIADKRVNETLRQPAIQAQGVSSSQNKGKLSPGALNTPRPTSGTTQAFVRTTKQRQGFTEQLLRPAMEKFGIVTSIKVEKNKGRAHVEFKDQRSLCEAIAATPILLNPQIAVKIFEWKECAGCGKMGHLQAQCWASGGQPVV